MNYLDLVKLYKTLPSLRRFQNSCEVLNMNGVKLTIEDVVKAALINNLNVLFIGEKGDGKTELMRDIQYTLFGGNGTWIRADRSLKIDKILSDFNLEKIVSGEGKVSEAKELRKEYIQSPITFIDEFNRMPEITQNELFSLTDGTFSYDGKQVKLGINGYHVVIASANPGAKYIGTFLSDPALLDRFHLIINFSNYQPEIIDLSNIVLEFNSPRCQPFTQLNDYTNTIIQLWNGVKYLNLTLDGLLSVLFLRKGVDYCESGKGSHSKIKMAAYIPGQICEGCHSAGGSCGKVFPLSTRGLLNVKCLAAGLKVVSDSKRKNVEHPDIDYLEIFNAYSLIAGCSGIIDERWVGSKYYGDIGLFINLVLKEYTNAFENKKNEIGGAFKEALEGKLSEEMLTYFDGMWGWLKELLLLYNTASQVIGEGGIFAYKKKEKVDELLTDSRLKGLIPVSLLKILCKRKSPEEFIVPELNEQY